MSTPDLAAKPPPVPYTYKALLVRVVDGDTVDVNIDLGFNCWMLERVRLEGIDTAEIFGPHASPLGQLARSYVITWCAVCPGLLLQSLRYDAREKYGRVLGDIFRVRADGTTDPVSLARALKAADLQKIDRGFA